MVITAAGGDHARSGENSAAETSPWHGMISIFVKDLEGGLDGHPFASRRCYSNRSARSSSVQSVR